MRLLMVVRLLGFVVSVGADVDCFLQLLPRSVDGLLRLVLQFPHIPLSLQRRLDITHEFSIGRHRVLTDAYY